MEPDFIDDVSFNPFDVTTYRQRPPPVVPVEKVSPLPDAHFKTFGFTKSGSSGSSHLPSAPKVYRRIPRLDVRYRRYDRPYPPELTPETPIRQPRPSLFVGSYTENHLIVMDPVPAVPVTDDDEPPHLETVSHLKVRHLPGGGSPWPGRRRSRAPKKMCGVIKVLAVPADDCDSGSPERTICTLERSASATSAGEGGRMRLFAPFAKKEIRLFDVKGEYFADACVLEHSMTVGDGASLIVTGDWEGRSSVSSARTGKIVVSLRVHGMARVRSMACGKGKGKELVFVGGDVGRGIHSSDLSSFDLGSGRPDRPHQGYDGLSDSAKALACWVDQDWLFGTADKDLRMWSISNPKDCHCVKLSRNTHNLHFSEEDRLLICPTVDGFVETWDPRKFSERVSEFNAHNGGRGWFVREVCRIGHRMFASVAGRATIATWNLDGKRLSYNDLGIVDLRALCYIDPFKDEGAEHPTEMPGRIEFLNSLPHAAVSAVQIRMCGGTGFPLARSVLLFGGGV